MRPWYAAVSLAALTLVALVGVIAIVLAGQDVPGELWQLTTTALGATAGASIPLAAPAANPNRRDPIP